jgi:hypothetical protein
VAVLPCGVVGLISSGCEERCHEYQAPAEVLTDSSIFWHALGLRKGQANACCKAQAAGELLQRLTELLGPEVTSRLRPSTFHSLCANLLRCVQSAAVLPCGVVGLISSGCEDCCHECQAPAEVLNGSSIFGHALGWRKGQGSACCKAQGSRGADRAAGGWIKPQAAALHLPHLLCTNLLRWVQCVSAAFLQRPLS